MSDLTGLFDDWAPDATENDADAVLRGGVTVSLADFRGACRDELTTPDMQRAVIRAATHSANDASASLAHAGLLAIAAEQARPDCAWRVAVIMDGERRAATGITGTPRTGDEPPVLVLPNVASGVAVMDALRAVGLTGMRRQLRLLTEPVEVARALLRSVREDV